MIQSITIYPQFIEIRARIDTGELIKLRYMGYTKAQAMQSFKNTLKTIQNFR